jgi:TolA-binding protein
MQFDGCPLSAPFHCFERTCATSAGACNSALNASPDGYGISTARRRLLASPTDIGEEKPIPCHTNCNADEKALPLQLFLDADTASTIPIATKNGKGVEISWLKFPSGSLVMDANSTGPQFSIRAVSDSLMREAENAIHVSRQSEFGGREGLTLPETVLSSAFECITEAQTPFPVEVVHRALLDYTRQPNNRDICLAYLYRIPALNYARWECLSSNPKQSENNPALVEAGITDCGAAGEGKVYAFIHSPAQGPAEAAVDTRSWIQKNLLYIVLGFTITLVFMLVILYAIARLKRYRKKFHKERDDVRKMEEEVMDMEMYGGGVHQRHESLVLTANPMQMQIADLQKRLDKNEIEMLEAENKQRLALSKERQKQISNLQADRERLAKELESARAALEAATVQPVVFRVSTSGPSGGTTSSPNATGGEGGGGGEGGVPSATRARTKERKAFGAAKPQGKKKKSLN